MPIKPLQNFVLVRACDPPEGFEAPVVTDDNLQNIGIAGGEVPLIYARVEAVGPGTVDMIQSPVLFAKIIGQQMKIDKGEQTEPLDMRADPLPVNVGDFVIFVNRNTREDILGGGYIGIGEEEIGIDEFGPPVPRFTPGGVQITTPAPPPPPTLFLIRVTTIVAVHKQDA